MSVAVSFDELRISVIDAGRKIGLEEIAGHLPTGETLTESGQVVVTWRRKFVVSNIHSLPSGDSPKSQWLQ